MDNKKWLDAEMHAIEKKLIDAGLNHKKLISSLHESQQKSGTNLIQYLALRNEDIRVLQDKLHQAGLSSLASSESHILKQVQLPHPYPQMLLISRNASHPLISYML